MAATVFTAADIRQAFATLLAAAGLGLTESQQVLLEPYVDPAKVQDGRFSVFVDGDSVQVPNRAPHGGQIYLRHDVRVVFATKLRPTRGGDMLGDYDAAIGATSSGIRKALHDDRQTALRGVRTHYRDTSRRNLGTVMLTTIRFHVDAWESAS